MMCSQCVREILCKLSDHRDVDNAGEKQSGKPEDDVFLRRSHHANHELHRSREEDLEGAGAGEDQGGLLHIYYYSQHIITPLRLTLPPVKFSLFSTKSRS